LILRIRLTHQRKIAKMVFDADLAAVAEVRPTRSVREEGPQAGHDSGAIEAMPRRVVLAANAEQVEQYRASDRAKRAQGCSFLRRTGD